MIRKLFLGVLLLAPLGFYPLLHSEPAHDKPNPPSQQEPLTSDQHIAMGCLAILPNQAIPGAIPWYPMWKLGQQETRALDELAEKNPVEFLERAMARVDKEVTSYRCIFDKQERVNGKLRQKETIRIHFRNEPFSVHMEWLKGQDRAFRTVYVKGENDDLITVRPSSLISFTLLKKVDAPDVRATSRFPITRFGMHMGARDTLEHMQAAQQKGTLHVRYAGKEDVKELGGRKCYKFVRAPYDPPEEIEQLNELTTYIDTATMLQAGSILKDTDGKLIATYFFRDIVVNPPFAEKQFDHDSL
jgi:Protein of unknown function (DUF1571)